MFILIKKPIRRSSYVRNLADDAYFAEDASAQAIQFALINVDEIAGITKMQDGGLWISPVNRDPAHIKPEEYYLEPGEGQALLDALKPYTVNPDEKDDN